MEELHSRQPSEEVAATIGAVAVPVEGLWFDLKREVPGDETRIDLHVPSDFNDGRGHWVRVPTDKDPLVRAFAPHLGAIDVPFTVNHTTPQPEM